MNKASSIVIVALIGCILGGSGLVSFYHVANAEEKNQSPGVSESTVISAQIANIDRSLLAIQKSFYDINTHSDDPSEWVRAYTVCIETAKVKIVELNLSGFFASDDEERKVIVDKVEQWKAAVEWMAANRNTYRKLEMEAKQVLRNEENLKTLRHKLIKDLARLEADVMPEAGEDRENRGQPESAD